MARLAVLATLILGAAPASGATIGPSIRAIRAIRATSGIRGAVWLAIVIIALIATLLIVSIIALIAIVPIGSIGVFTKPGWLLVIAERTRRRILA